MNPTLTAAAAAFFATAAALCAPLSAQDVILSEVRADADGRWVELHNRTSSSVDLSTWSLHFASRTTGMPQNYWWAFPLGTTIAGGGYLRVHWYQAAPATIAPGDLYTGNTVWDFLFGLGGEQLRADRGALGLFRSQLDSMMNSPAIVEDWVSWGDHGFQREPLAIANGRWTGGEHTPAIGAGTSLARYVFELAVTAPHVAQWFADPSPTPLAPNLSGGSVTSRRARSQSWLTARTRAIALSGWEGFWT